MLIPLIYTSFGVDEASLPQFAIFIARDEKFAAVRTNIANTQWAISPDLGFVGPTESPVDPPPMSMVNLELFSMLLRGLLVRLGIDDISTRLVGFPTISTPSVHLVIAGLPFGQVGGVLTPPRG